MSGKYALIIANTEYIDSGLAQLTAPGKDAEDFARVLKDPSICAFDDVKILMNQLSSTALEAIDEFFDQKKPDDLLVLYFSGHGVRDEIGSLYLAVRNTIRTRLRSTAIKSDYIREVMDQSRSKRQVLILDCCNSGAFAQGTKAEVGGSMGIISALQGYGRFVLTASDATQFAWEGNKVVGETENSLFTYFLVKGLEGEADNDGDGKITVDELYDYAYEQVKLVTPKQTPSKFSSKQQGEIILRQFTRIEDIKPISLSDQLLSEIENPYPEVRLRAVQQLTRLLGGKNLGLVRSAKEALERLEKEDDSRRVSLAAKQALELMQPPEQYAGQEPDAVSVVPENPEGNNEKALDQLTGQGSHTDQFEVEPTSNQYPEREEKAPTRKTLLSQRSLFFLAIALVVCIGLSTAGYYMLQNVPKTSLPTLTITNRPANTATQTQRLNQTQIVSFTPVIKTVVDIKVSKATMYRGPGLGYYLTDHAAFSRGTELTVLARNASGLWLLAQAPDGTTGWLYVEWVEISFDPQEISTALTIPALPATPTRRPNSQACNPPPNCGGGPYDPATCQCV